MEKIEVAFELIERFHEFGFEAYLVGGSVRDLIMNRPLKDIDITTNALPLQMEVIAEDKHRINRADRFYTEFKFEIEKDTLEAMEDFRGRLTTHSDHTIYDSGLFYSVHSKPVSFERIRDELEKILLSSNRIKGLELLDKTGIMDEILPEVSILKGVDQSKLHHPEKDVYIHTMLALESISDDEKASLELILGILLHDIGKTLTRSFESETEIHFYEHEKIGSEIAEIILKRLKFPLVTINKVKWLVANHMRIHHFNEMKKSKKVSLIEHEYFTDLLKLAIADIKGSSGINNTEHEDFNIIYEIDKFVKEYKIEKENRPILTQKLINGFDIINLGVSKKEGIKIGQILEKVNDAVIEGTINTKDEALEYAKEMI